MKTALVWLMVSFLCLLGTADALELGREVQTQDGFALKLPDKWIEIPKEILQKYTTLVNQHLDKSQWQSYEYGFQMLNEKGWMSYPYVLIQVKKTGRIPDGQLKRYKMMNEKLSEELKKTESNFSDVLANSELGELVYDSDNRILWTTLAMDVQGVGKVKAQVGTKLTSFGMIQVNGYATAEQFPEYQPIFQQIVKEMTLDDAIRYQPQFTDSFPLIGGVNSGKVLSSALIGAAIGAVVGLIAWFRRRSQR